MNYSKKLQKTLRLITHVQEESAMGDGLVLASLEKLQPFLDNVQLMIVKLANDNLDNIQVIAQSIISTSGEAKSTLTEIYSERLDQIQAIKEKLEQLYQNISKINVSLVSVPNSELDTEKQKKYLDALKELFLVLIETKELSSLSTLEDRKLLAEMDSQIKPLDLKLKRTEDLALLKTFESKISEILSRYHFHYTELHELSKIHPSLFETSDNSFTYTLVDLLKELKANNQLEKTEES